MRVIDIQSERTNETNTPVSLDMETIRRRVAMIKSGWSDEVARARAVEGQRRRQELEDLLLDCLCDVEGSEEACDVSEHSLSLVG